APASLPRREQRKAGRRRSPSSPARYDVCQRTTRGPLGAVRESLCPGRRETQESGRDLGAGLKFCHETALFSPAPLRCLPRPRPRRTANFVLRRPERPPLFCHLRQIESAVEAMRGDFWGRNLGQPFSGAGVPRRGTSPPFRGTVSRCAEQVVRAVEENMRSAEQAVLSAEASRFLRNGSPAARNGSLVRLVL